MLLYIKINKRPCRLSDSIRGAGFNRIDYPGYVWLTKSFITATKIKNR